MAIGAVMSQLQGGVERPIAFASRALSPTEQRYSVGEREALACLWACERWHMYLYGRAFTLRTDHQALTTLLATSGIGHKPLRLHRWADCLQQYNFRLHFTPGRENVVADLLSRAIPNSPPAMAHEGHLGIVKLKQRCRDVVWWPGIDREIETLVKDCTACLLSGKTRAPAPPPPMQPLDWPSKPWEHLQLDICGKLHGVPHHQRFLVVVYNLHSKWPEAAPVGSVTAKVLVDILDSLFTRWGLPERITTDNGPQMVSHELSSYLEGKGICHIPTAFYNPAANGGVERLNQSLKNGIRAHLAQGCTLTTSLLQTLLHYRATRHATTGVSPASLMLGRELQLPLDRFRPTAAWAPAHPVRAAVDTRQRRMKDRFDRARRAKPPAIAVNCILNTKKNTKIMSVCPSRECRGSKHLRRFFSSLRISR